MAKVHTLKDLEQQQSSSSAFPNVWKNQATPTTRLEGNGYYDPEYSQQPHQMQMRQNAGLIFFFFFFEFRMNFLICL